MGLFLPHEVLLERSKNCELGAKFRSAFGFLA